MECRMAAIVSLHETKLTFWVTADYSIIAKFQSQGGLTTRIRFCLNLEHENGAFYPFSASPDGISGTCAGVSLPSSNERWYAAQMAREIAERKPAFSR